MNIIAGIFLLAFGLYVVIGGYPNKKLRMYPMIAEFGITIIVFGIYALLL